MSPDRSGFRGSPWLRLARDLGLLSLSALLFSLSFPNLLIERGWAWLSWGALAPVFWVLAQAGWRRSALYGVFTGFVTYALFNFWLVTFHPLAIFFVPVIYGAYYLSLFPLLKAADRWFPRAGAWVQALIWVAYEYLRIQGFLGYSYGVLGSAHFENLWLLQSASLGGYWILTWLTIVPSLLLARAFRNGTWTWGTAFDRALAGFWALSLVGLALWGAWMAPLDLTEAPSRRIALVQHDSDPWKGGTAAYRQGLERLIRLTDRVLAQEPALDLIVWSETAFVPSIHYHSRYRENPEYFSLIRQLEEYLSRVPAPVVLGNGHGERRPASNAQGWERFNYNAGLVWTQGRFLDPYRKTHLVPFTEHFPYEGIWTWLKDLLEASDTHFWDQGSEYKVFDLGDWTIATPICFEDTFGYHSRELVNRGAQVLVNLTNDSWAGTPVNMWQHLALSAFRAVETRRSLVRSTNGGITAAFDPNGRLLGLLPPFVQDTLTLEVPLSQETSLYRLWGDWFAWLCLILSAGLMALGAAAALRRAFR